MWSYMEGLIVEYLTLSLEVSFIVILELLSLNQTREMYTMSEPSVISPVLYRTTQTQTPALKPDHNC